MTDTDSLGEALGTDFLRITAELGDEERDYLERTRSFVHPT